MTVQDDIRTETVTNTFEGQAVAHTRAKLAGASSLELDDATYAIDEVLRVVVDVRVTNVNHTINETTGLLQRVHTLKVLNAKVVNWDLDLVHRMDNA